MNVERLEQLADAIEKDEYVFPNGQKAKLNMSTFYLRDFNGVLQMCLIGFTIMLFGGDEEMLVKSTSRELTDAESNINSLNLDAEARNLLGLSEADSHELFYGTLTVKMPGATVASVIRKYLRTGKVDWPLLA